MTEEVIVVDAVEVDPIIQDYSKYELDKGMAVDLVRGVPEIVRERRDLLAQLNDVLALDRDDPKTAKVAAELRKQIKNNRTQGFEKWRKTTKDVYLRAGQFIDAIARKEMAINEQVEGQLEAIEKHAENLERQRLEALQSERKLAVAPYVAEDFSYPDLSNMDQEVFEAYLSTKKIAFEAKIAAEKKAEEERLEKERKEELFKKRREIFLPLYDFLPPMDKDEIAIKDMSEEDFQSHIAQAKSNKANYEIAQEKIRQENIKLKEEADKKEAEAKKQREAQEVILAEERRKAQELADKQQKEKEVLEAQLKKERDEKAAEEAKKQAELDTEKLRKENLAKAGDKAILLDWVTKSFQEPLTPDGLTASGYGKINEILAKYDGFRKWALNQIEA